MHDFMLAKEIIDHLKSLAQKEGWEKIAQVELEIGQIALAHDGFDVHEEEIHLDNLQFGLKSLAEKETLLAGASFALRKAEGQNWKIVNIEVQ